MGWVWYLAWIYPMDESLSESIQSKSRQRRGVKLQLNWPYVPVSEKSKALDLGGLALC